MKPQTLTDGPLIGQELTTDTHVFTLRGKTSRYAFVAGRLKWVPGK